MTKPARTRKDVEADIRRDISKYIFDPVGFDRYAFPWGKVGGPLEEAQSYSWQDWLLGTIGQKLQNPATRYDPIRIAVASGKGVGKSCLVARTIIWAMSTCDDCKVLVTANTDTQLATKTWPEVEKWMRMSINRHWFTVNATSITAKDPLREGTWRVDRIPWSENNTEAFAGLHNKGKRILVIFDEASAIHDKIYEVTEGALTDAQTEIIWLAFGNPTQNTGRFRELFGRFQHRWVNLQLDSRKVEGTNKQQIAEWQQDYGEDSDFFRVIVRGEFPRAGLNQFISSETIARCRKYQSVGFTAFPKILGVDVARFGDDKTVFMLRQGRKSQLLGQFRGLDTAQVSAHAIDFINQYQVDATVVDSDGIGNTVFDQLKFAGYSKRLFEFHGGKPANNSVKYFNRRAEIWGLMRDWLEATAEIPDIPDIEQDLAGPQYTFSAQQQIQLEKKDDMKSRGLASPDYGDALAMTFAVNVMAPKEVPKAKMWSPGMATQGWMA